MLEEEEEGSVLMEVPEEEEMVEMGFYFFHLPFVTIICNTSGMQLRM